MNLLLFNLLKDKKLDVTSFIIIVVCFFDISNFE